MFRYEKFWLWEYTDEPDPCQCYDGGKCVFTGVCVRVYVIVCVFVCVFVHGRGCERSSGKVYMYIHTHTHIFACMRIRIDVFLCKYVYMYMYIHLHAHTHKCMACRKSKFLFHSGWNGELECSGDMYTLILTNLYMHICMYIQIYTYIMYAYMHI